MMVEKAKLYIPAFISLGLMILLALVFTNELKKEKLSEKENGNTYYLTIENDNKCQESIYKDNIYLYCINEIYFLENNEKKSLRSVLDDKININKIISDMVIIEDNEKYKIYEDKNSIANINFKILYCNNKYYIGTINLDYREYFCE